ncbi:MULTISPECIES: CidA/LrgA family protein [unclassified Shewanella]|uniref:CidA/LrgA family protein n=1 Tax=unclassified Shewanella TaxID=196818 RepID=UPI001BC3D9CA|nr:MULTISPECIES: CidA/LrgA family protein [unclassified Shewanella]GIU11963.1 protein LrgA [Shewanella sp. MBTL60-112-B1]GIU31851.1 protein LrgA [Shewanella sp. MBTL60-112-B2]
MASLASPSRINLKQTTITAGQIALLCLFAWGCQTLAKQIHSPIPGSVIGLGVLLLLLACKLIPETSVNLGSTWLIGDLLLFFIPPVVAVIKYQDLLEHYGAVLIGSMLAASSGVLVGTAFTVDRLFKFEHKQNLKRQLARQQNNIELSSHQ